jgi:hypothetical protein
MFSGVKNGSGENRPESKKHYYRLMRFQLWLIGYMIVCSEGCRWPDCWFADSCRNIANN